MEKKRGRGLKDEALEAEEGRKRVKEEKAGGGERHIDGRERAVDARKRQAGVSVRGRDFKRNQFGVAVQSNVTLAAAGVNVGRNSNFTPGPR